MLVPNITEGERKKVRELSCSRPGLMNVCDANYFKVQWATTHPEDR